MKNKTGKTDGEERGKMSGQQKWYKNVLYYESEI